MTIEYDKDLTDLTTFKVGAKAAIYAEYEDEKDLLRLSRTPEFINNEFLHIGSGSNLLFLSTFKGIVLHSKIKGIQKYVKDRENVFVIAGAGEKWTDLVDWCISHGIAGLENMAGIPGEVGASAVQNVGAYGAEAGDFIHSVVCFDTETRKTVTLKQADCMFGYRDSIFKHNAKGKLIVMQVSYRLRYDTRANNLEYAPLKKFAETLGRTPSTRELADEVIRLRDSKLPNPALIGSAGSFFKNPEVNKYFFEQEIKPRGIEMPEYPASQEGKVKLSGGWLIDHAGLKGYRIGGAEVWPKQALVIANTGNATGEDVAQLADHIIKTVKLKYGIELRPEVNYIDTRIKVTILGSGTSKGVPEIGCTCPTCMSTDPKDKRLRSSVLVETHGMKILIDASPDLRQQALRIGLSQLDAILLTHQHYDHVGGIDDVRPFCIESDLPIYTNPQTANDLRRRLDYCFRQVPYPGVPKLDLHEVGLQPFMIKGLKIEPIEVMHGSLPIYGYRIGDFAYITDIKTISDEEKEKLKNLEVLILSCLRVTHEHFAHLILPEALALIEELKPKRCYLTHACHNLGKHEEIAKILPSGVEFAYDGEVITIN
ncbi:MAG: UDP-N-acetylmuramate dehydrogenase [Muribaculaceae bacterium]|nr:UDP-N-acetylmuramate dehydrogenase [Muribaculaceae bacterium]MDE6523490.1 UDP-N-acetylmuramate dehydrogenase [Muribaculaceae bacterium]